MAEPPDASAAMARVAPGRHGRSGRGFVVVVTFWIIAITLALLTVFRQWRSTYHDLSAYGLEHVAPAVDPLRKTVPPALSPEAWTVIVGQVHELLVELTASGALDLSQMRALRREIQERINGARPETAAEALAGLWDALEDQAGPILTARPRYVLAGTVRPLSKLRPSDVPAADWALAVVQTRAMLAALGSPKALPQSERRRLQGQIETQLADTTSERAPEDLHAIWQLVAARRPLPENFPRCVLETPGPGENADSAAPAP
jgi:hypothetical protein